MAQKTYSKHTAKFLAAVGENMPELTGQQMQAWIQNPLILQKALRQLDQTMIDLRPSFIQPWKEIIVGGKTNVELIAELSKYGVSFNEVMMKHCPEILTPHKARLAIVTQKELGFTGDPTLAPVLKRLHEVGLSYHAAVGPYLRLAYLEQEEDKDHLTVAMEPLPFDDEDPTGQALWFLDRYGDHPTLISDGQDNGWNYQPSELVCIIGELESISPSA
jgi:hypothetical protein